VLVLNIGGIGDMVMATPALQALASRVSCGPIDILTTDRSVPVVERAPFTGSVYCVDVSALTGRPTVYTILRLIGSLMVLVRLRLGGYDLAVDLMATESPRAAQKRKFLLSVISAGRTAGRDTNGWADYLDVGAPEDLFSRVHETDRKLAVVRALAPGVSGRGMRVFSDREDREAGLKLSRSVRKKGSAGIAVLVPGGWRPTRRWSAERFVAVGDYLMERYGLSVAVCGSSDERDVVDTVAGGMAREASVLLDVPPRVLFEMFGRCDIIITNDTGPMHLAAAAERPGIVAIFGPENPDRYAPGRGAGVVVLSDRVDCAPCTRYRCPDMRCLEGIGVDRVRKAVDRLMAAGAGKAGRRPGPRINS
jgi:ADP-heptose:LPS heptosyltransferase